mmetsp:Transcript_29615/g.65229  ORF Transcript_29615/g.65229 Transcript_29615/m.65229 type:complete len:121 (-) Transcript_29615:302-664(-)
MSVPANTTGFPRQALINLGLQIGLINILGGGKVLAVRFVDLIHIVHQIRKVACDIVHVVNVEIDPSSSCPGRFVLGGVCVCVASAVALALAADYIGNDNDLDPNADDEDDNDDDGASEEA